jgi:hypothetical protein
MASVSAKGSAEKKPWLSQQEWSFVTVQGILENDFYIGTLRKASIPQGKINGCGFKKTSSEHIIFETTHRHCGLPCFCRRQEQRKHRTYSNYRGIKKYEMSFGFLVMWRLRRADVFYEQ